MVGRTPHPLRDHLTLRRTSCTEIRAKFDIQVKLLDHVVKSLDHLEDPVPVIRSADAAVHLVHGSTFSSFVAPSRGSAQLCAWQLTCRWPAWSRPPAHSGGGAAPS